ncbi:MAG: type I-E CRISPR-associated protein Cas6/Cse3/CasE [Deltaproteobacteria bacterium]|nr:type I-E CRISPR-associated protein Cas6/Cse3/CasE [Deltaproteobacteria bacterium]
MFLSRLLIDIGGNPDRPRPGRQWLRNLYHVHQRLCMAFPSAQRKADDADFLEPFRPDDFGKGHVHEERKVESGFLFRIDPQPGGRAMILVQSAVTPDWDYAFHNAGYLLAASPDLCYEQLRNAVKTFEPGFAKGQRLRFRLAANPTRKIDTKSGPDGKKRHGTRVPVPSMKEIEEWRANNHNEDPRPFICSKLLDWLTRKSAASGFSIDKDSTTVQPGYIYCKKPENRQGGSRKDKREDSGRRRSVRYEGILEVSDADNFRDTIIRGIGSGKAFGFGLLSVAPVNPLDPAEAK